jgi:hypothetical protein
MKIHPPVQRPRNLHRTYAGLFIFTIVTGCYETSVMPDSGSPPRSDDASAPPQPDDAGETVGNTGESSIPDSGSTSLGGEDSVADAGTSTDSGVPDASVLPLTEGAPVVNSSVQDLDLDVFGTFDNHYWFIATEAQVAVINAEFEGPGGGFGEPGGFGGPGGDYYTPPTTATERTIDHFLATTPAGRTADFGEMQVKLVGQSTGRLWSTTTLPNFKIDSDHVTPDLRVGEYEHLRFNNGVWGSIYREKFVFDYYRELGYPAPLATYGWVSTTVWPPDVKVPYIVVESYKRGFCRDRAEYFGGECPNMWEFAQDLDEGVFDYPENCQFEACESSRANEFQEVVSNARYGSGTWEEVGEYVDWERFHEFQCLSWIFGTSDDAIHGGNNTVWVERPDGKFQLLPYSIDISLDLWGQGDIGLSGFTSVAQICQNDEVCWADTIATCERLIEGFVEADPVQRLEDLHEQIVAAGMLRAGDEQRYADLRATLERLITSLPVDLEYHRLNPNGGGYCEYPTVDCAGRCDLPANCELCQDWYYEQGEGGAPLPPIVEPRPLPALEDIALPPGDPVPVPTNVPPPPPPVDLDGGVGGDGGNVYPKPDFCFWEDPGVKPVVGRELYRVK